MKKNCWEFMNCGREPGGEKEQELGVCPAATNTRFDGRHGGKNAGRACWVVAGTFCWGGAQGEFASRLNHCLECTFYWTVVEEEGDKFNALP